MVILFYTGFDYALEKKKALASYDYGTKKKKYEQHANTDLSSLPSKGLDGSGSLLRVTQPLRPFTDAPATEACKIINVL